VSHASTDGRAAANHPVSSAARTGHRRQGRTSSVGHWLGRVTRWTRILGKGSRGRMVPTMPFVPSPHPRAGQAGQPLGIREDPAPRTLTPACGGATDTALRGWLVRESIRTPLVTMAA
jgi:hypothetical protein